MSWNYLSDQSLRLDKRIESCSSVSDEPSADQLAHALVLRDMIGHIQAQIHTEVQMLKIVEQGATEHGHGVLMDAHEKAMRARMKSNAMFERYKSYARSSGWVPSQAGLTAKGSSGESDSVLPRALADVTIAADTSSATKAGADVHRLTILGGLQQQTPPHEALHLERTVYDPKVNPSPIASVLKSQLDEIVSDYNVFFDQSLPIHESQ